MNKSFYQEDGLQLNEDGLVASSKMEKSIQSIYKEYLDKGFSPSELREMLFSQVFFVSTFENAMKMCE